MNKELQQWEYKVLTEKFFGTTFDEKKLNELGEQGWELVAPSSYGQLQWYFKRPKTQPQ